MNPIAIYQSPTGTVDVRLDGDTVWLSQEQMTQLFGRERSVITKHIRKVFNEGELDEQSNVQNLHIPHSDKPVRFYNLDVIISVGYRVKSPQGVQFRQWATRLLREHLTLGYTVNRQRFEANAAELEAALTLIRKAAQTPQLSADLKQCGQATDLFARDRGDGLATCRRRPVRHLRHGPGRIGAAGGRVGTRAERGADSVDCEYVSQKCL